MGFTSLFFAAREGHLDVVHHLVEVGAQIDQDTDLLETPLFVAAQEGHLDVVRHLVEVGAQIDQATNWPIGPYLIVLCSTGRPS